MNTDAIAKIYVELVQAGRRTINEVPKQIREQVQALLDGDGNA